MCVCDTRIYLKLIPQSDALHHAQTTQTKPAVNNDRESHTLEVGRNGSPRFLQLAKLGTLPQLSRYRIAHLIQCLVPLQLRAPKLRI